MYVPQIRSRTQPWNNIPWLNKSWLSVWHIKQVVRCLGACGAAKGGSCPRKPQSQWSGGQKTQHFRAEVYHRERLLAQSIHVYSSIQVFVRSNWSNQRRQLSQKAPKPMIRRTEDKAFQSKSLPLWQIACSEHPCRFKHTSVREEELEQPKEAAVPESPKANDPEDTRQSISEQKSTSVTDCLHWACMYIQAHICSWGGTGATKGGSCPRKPQSERSGGQKTTHFSAKVYHCDRLLAVSIHVYSITQVFVRSNSSNQSRQLSQKAPKPMIGRTEEKAFQSRSLPLWQTACSEHPCIFKHTSVREEQLEQPKEAVVPESPKANDPEDRRQSISEQKSTIVTDCLQWASMYIQSHKCSWGGSGATRGGSCPRKPQSERCGGQKTKHFRAKVYHCDRLLAVSIHVYSSIQVFVRRNWSNQRKQLSQKALKPTMRRTENCYIVLFSHTAHL